jgi:stage II sporulation protein D
MKTITWLASALLAFSSLNSMTMLHAAEIPTDISLKNKPATLKIRIAEKAEGAVLEVKGRYEVFDPVSHLPLTSGFFGKRQAIFAEGDGIHWGEKFPSIHQMRIVPGDGESTTLVNGIEYRGCIEIYNLGGHLSMVNEVDIESYLKSILSAQTPAQEEEHLLEAMAIIARTHAYYLAQRNTQAQWHVTAEEAKYYGYGMTMQNIAIDRAVENTRHIVMTFRNRPFAATWTEDSAGRTASYANIFRKQVTTPSGVVTPLAAKERSQHAWTLTIPTKEMARVFGFGKITAVNPYLDRDSEKVYAVQLTDGILSKNIDFFAFQQKIGSDKLRSNDFTVALQSDKIVFKGWGKGHGVGLCLYSAHLLAERGASVAKILTQFFPQMEMKKIRNLPENESLENR